MAALLGILVLRHFEKQCVDLSDDEFVRVYSYGTPSCVDAKLADHPRTLRLVTSGKPSSTATLNQQQNISTSTKHFLCSFLFVFNPVVLHDDVVPRLTPTSVRGLLKHLLYIRETWVKTHLSDDLSAITERAYHAWPTRLRGSFTLMKKKGAASARRLKKSCKEKIQPTDPSPEIDGVRAGGEIREADVTATCPDDGSGDEGVDVEGDLFFDPLDAPLNESDDESIVGNEQRSAPNGECDNDWVPFDEPQTESDEKQQFSLEDDASPLIVEELPLPRMFIPGRIVHIYTHRGGYKAGKLDNLILHKHRFPSKKDTLFHLPFATAFVPRTFRSLRRISMGGNMLSDHMTKSYYEGLLEVKTIRAAKQDLPPWVGLADDCTWYVSSDYSSTPLFLLLFLCSTTSMDACSSAVLSLFASSACCASLFTWASTSNTEAQAARDKHNCRACGGLVCEPCSKQKVPILAIGISTPVRVCDRCYNGWGTLHGDLDLNENEETGEGGVSAETRSKRADKKSTANSRRSAVVDELASRIPSI